MKKLCLKGFLGLYRLWSKAFLLTFYFEQVASALLMHIFITGVWHLVGTFTLLRGHQVWVSCMAWHLLSSTAEMPPAVFLLLLFLSHGWLYSFCPVTPTILNVFNIDLLVLITQPNFCPEGICWGKTGSTQLT